MKADKKIPAEALLNVEIQDMVAEGKCLVRVGNLVIFVSQVAPGDVVDLRVTKSKKSFLEAVPVKFHKYSELRVEPFCQHFGTCGGCKWQHLGYDTQLKYKQQQVVDTLERIGKVELPEIPYILSSPQRTYYRNKLEYTFSFNGWLTNEQIQSGEDYDRRVLGFHTPARFDKIIDVQHCHLQPEPSNEIRLFIRDYGRQQNLRFGNIVKQTGNLRNLIIRTAQSTGQIMVLLQCYLPHHSIEPLLDAVYEKFPQITSLNYVLNNKGNETFHDLEIVNYKGLPYIEEEMEGLRFRIGPKSFYQTNSEGAYNLYKVARDFAQLQGTELVYDLYTGTGTIAHFVARQAAKVIGVEYVEQAVADARLNAEVNNITNTEFFAGDMKDILTAAFTARHGHPDLIITDPPRAGMHPDVVQRLLELRCPRIVYISCNPATQARDLEMLDSAYKVTKVQPVDMFPHTHHVENVVLLELK
ncbi:23S rRNA (uracil(1939)-C(5))-methyltransferase RlmD [Hymenobacter sp. ASUV-10]|uniref:23S rRNA (Uracil(1939)-C(5))-methyltransferase RlmD n=1 Tax=Hymenobacter aranciens TaxID=3063996 RepID=A0ABT9BER5_9BACT|nr:23S rRNA (uracil(1939)-C(5))-methyltransferase RlmD [Hymenobacter sp. ASUV-10]MDO7876265.1 23S rRNA (uracil(1939)-C(5))-methyltransferase RlmD [Hymenobacter sp. ASUV-10]